MNNTDNTLIPELRFPEFVNEGEWKKKQLGIICDYFNGTSHENGVNESGNYFLISLNSIDIEGKLKKDMKRISYTDNSLKKNDLIMVLSDVAHGNFLGLTEIIPDDRYVLNQRMACLRIKDTKEYVSFYLKTYINNNQKYFKRKGQGSSQLNLSKASVTEFPLLIPHSPSEQQKISDCLSSLDDLISAHTDKLDALKEHKNGLMQNLFPKERETVPKLRFAAFEKDGEWVEKNLIDTTNKKVKWSFTGGPFGSNLKASDYTSNGFRIIQLQNIGDGEFIDNYKIYTSEGKADELLSCNIYAGDIIISKMGDPVGRACIIPDNLNRCVMASDGIRLVVDEEKYSKYFLYSLINSKRIRKAIEKKATGSTRKRIGLDELKSIKLSIPKEVKEQQKIANTLSALDDLIKEQAEKIEQLKQHKKGLMQGLFPKIKE